MEPVTRVEVTGTPTLEDYAQVAALSTAVRDLREEAARLAPRLRGRTVWMVNSTARGGGVAEMLPTVVTLLNELGVRTEWLVINPEERPFFPLTKRLHNLLHAAEVPLPTPADAEVYERVSWRCGEALARLIQPGDILVVHDPQPLGAGALAARELGVPAVWRCHIGVDEHTSGTAAAWEFLRPWLEPYRRALFSAPDYIPSFLAGRAAIMYPALDPLSDKNRELTLHQIVGILCNSGAAITHWPMAAPPFRSRVRRLRPDGSWGPGTEPDDIGLLARPIVAQVSRWDRLKGFAPLMEAFRLLKRRHAHDDDERRRRRIAIVRLVLAGPDPASVSDDPEAMEVLHELATAFRGLDPELQPDVAVLALPMDDRRENALVVNALQRASSIVAQNSLREGFGLTVAEAMWKRIPVIGNERAVGVRTQVRDGLDGRLVDGATNVDALADTLAEMLGEPKARDAWGRSAQRRAYEHFLVFTLVAQWLDVLAGAAVGRAA